MVAVGSSSESPVFIESVHYLLDNMSNAYNFDFLRTEHLDETVLAQRRQQQQYSSSGPSQPPPSSSINFAAVANKPDLEKQFDVIAFLQKHRGSGFLSPAVIYRGTGVDVLEGAVAELLKKNPKVRTENVPDPENPALWQTTYAYRAKYANVKDRASLLAQINRMNEGISWRDLEDSYETVEKDLEALITAGDVIAWNNTEDKDKKIFPRGEQFLVELDGIVQIKDSARSVHTDVDPRRQVRRGEAVQVGGQWFRVSSAVKEGPLSEQPVRAQAPLSVVSLVDLNSRNEIDGYIRPFTDRQLPLDGRLSESSLKRLQEAKAAREKLVKLTHGRSLMGSNAQVSTTISLGKRPANKEAVEEAIANPALGWVHARRHGCTKDVREMYLQTRSLVPESDNDLREVLIEHKLMDPSEPMRRPRLTRLTEPDGKPKKRRYYERKNQRLTNTHLEHTEIGALLAMAAEQQRQGKSVGDGGM